jgi:cytochrome c2
MWNSMRAAGQTPPAIDEQKAADLFAFFYASRFFEQPGDAGRGKHIFSERGCVTCHNPGKPATPGIQPLPPSAWTAITDPIELAAAMWNHAPQMQAEVARAGKRWPELSGQDLSDLLVYVRNGPRRGKTEAHFTVSAGSEGAALFQSKGCAACHSSGKSALSERLRGLTLTAIAARMWNHAPLMKAQPVRLEPAEMRELLSYLWARPFFEDRGSVAGGRKVFAAKHCVTCHDDPASGAPRITPRPGGFNGITMVSALWKHGPTMLNRMKSENIAWPHLDPQEMSNLISYLNSGERK